MPTEAVRRSGWAALAGLVVVQLWVLYVAVPAGAPGIPHLDKLGHLLIFALPALVAGLLGSRPVLAGLVVHAVVAEPLQGWLTTVRVADPWDALANLVGIGVGAALAAVLGGSR